MKQVLSFDIDNTLNEPKMPISDEMANLLAAISRKFIVAPISGQKFEQFLIQIIDRLPKNANLANFHLFVGQGTQYFRFRENPENQENIFAKNWQQVYNFALAENEIREISAALEKAAKELGFWYPEHENDDIIENRESMVAFSPLGQHAKVDAKKAWDPDMKKREKIAKLAGKYAPEFAFEVAGTTTINAFRPGQNKKFGMEKLMENLGVSREEILYFGDMTQPGGNDFPVREMGIETLTVRDWQETANILRGILATGK